MSSRVLLTTSAIAFAAITASVHADAIRWIGDERFNDNLIEPWEPSTPHVAFEPHYQARDGVFGVIESFARGYTDQIYAEDRAQQNSSVQFLDDGTIRVAGLLHANNYNEFAAAYGSPTNPWHRSAQSHLDLDFDADTAFAYELQYVIDTGGNQSRNASISVAGVDIEASDESAELQPFTSSLIDLFANPWSQSLEDPIPPFSFDQIDPDLVPITTVSGQNGPGVFNVTANVDASVESGEPEEVFGTAVIAFELLLTALPMAGDFDGSGWIDQADLDLVLSGWGGANTGFANKAGFNTTLIDQEELDAVLSGWGNTAAPNFAGFSVPEPVAALPLLAAGISLSHRRRA